MRPDGPVLRAADYKVVDVGRTLAEDLVSAHHYAGGGPNTATFVHGLFHVENALRCLGVAWWLPPTRRAAEATWPEWRRVLSLSRLVIVPDVPKNAATFLLSRSVKMIRRDPRWRCLVTYADESQGHVGTIYRAAGWEYCGRTKPETRYVDAATGRQMSRKSGPRSRTHAEMTELGCRIDGKFPKHKFRLVLPETAVDERQGSLL